MICPECGEQLSDNAVCCWYCGKRVDSSQVQKEEAPATVPTIQYAEETISEKLGVPLTVLGIAIFAVIAVIGLLVYGEIYFYNGYAITGWLCTISMILMIVGAIMMVVTIASGTEISEKEQSQNSVLLILAAVFTLILIINFFSTKSTPSSSPSTDHNSSASSHQSSNEMSAYAYALTYLKTSNVKIEHNSSYTVCTGTIKNTGTYTIRYVKIKGAFATYSGTVQDTDWTYAVGSEGLAPGESTSFYMSVPKDTSIKKCEITFIN